MSVIQLLKISKQESVSSYNSFFNLSEHFETVLNLFIYLSIFHKSFISNISLIHVKNNFKGLLWSYGKIIILLVFYF